MDNTQYLDHFDKANIAVIGDIMLDRYVYGRVTRISPEAPIPVLKQNQPVMETLGGAGNVVRNLADLRVKTSLIGVIGKDNAGKTVESLLAQQPLKIGGYLHQDEALPTIEKTRFIAQHQQVMRLDVEDEQALSQVSFNKINEAAMRLIKDGANILLLSDYGKGLLRHDFVQTLISEAKMQGLATIIDPKGKDYSRYHGADYITPNLSELALATGLDVDDDEAIYKAGCCLIEKYDIGCVIATRSEKGMSIIQKSQADGAPSYRHMDALAREVYDVAGAGDTVIATIAAGLGGGLDIWQSAHLANYAAGVVVAKFGTSTVNRQEIQEAAGALQPKARYEKILNWQDAKANILERRKKGEVIGFANGCFDLLHPGHLALIRAAKAQCDCLVMGLNSDQSVKRLKGETRPIMNQHERAEILAALMDVDLVVLFDEDTPLKLIETLRPDCLVKGSDYKEDEIAGAKEVKSWGGRVHLVELRSGHSSTNVIGRMNEGNE